MEAFDHLSAGALSERIEQQKNTCKLLLSDIQAPHNLERNLSYAIANCEQIETRLDAEIETAKKTLETLLRTRDEKVIAAARQRDALQYRHDHLRALYADNTELLEAMQKRLRLIESSSEFDKLKELRRKIAALEAQLPENLRGKSLAEIKAATADETTETEGDE
jgi:hypothetical protein